VLDTFGKRVAEVAGPRATGLLLDFQEMSATDIGTFIELVRAVGDAARTRSLSPFGIIVPAGDTLAYPARLLARVADVIVIRLGTEHRPGTRPGPLTTPEFVRRQLGNRAVGIGVSRLGAEFPLYGYLWTRDASARIITYREANDMILREAGAFRRDPSSQFLTTELRDGSTIWLPDARTIQRLISSAQSRGVNIVTLAGPAGADPAIRETIVKR
jgi:spore germination protein YaaH